MSTISGPSQYVGGNAARKAGGQTVERTYAASIAFPGVYRLVLRTEDVREHDLACDASGCSGDYSLRGRAHLRRVYRQTYHDNFGNLYDEHLWVPGGTSERTFRVYDNDATDWHIGLMNRETKYSVAAADEARFVSASGFVSGGEIRTREFEYDDRGRLTLEVIEPETPELYLQRELRRDAFGLVRAVIEEDSYGKQRIERIDYDEEGIYPTRVENAVGHEAYEWHLPDFGTTFASSDANGLVSNFRHDGFGRTKQEAR